MVMYTIPTLYGAEEYLQAVEPDAVDVCEEECTFAEGSPCDRDIFELCLIYLEEQGIQEPGDAYEAVDTYVYLRDRLNTDLAGQ